MTATQLQINLHDRKPLAVLNLTGQMSGLENYRLKNMADQLLQDDYRILVLDLKSVTVLDSAGIGMINQLRNQLGRVGGRVALVMPDQLPLRQAITVCGLDRIVETYTDLPTALRQIDPTGTTPAGGAPAAAQVMPPIPGNSREWEPEHAAPPAGAGLADAWADATAAAPQLPPLAPPPLAPAAMATSRVITPLPTSAPGFPLPPGPASPGLSLHERIDRVETRLERVEALLRRLCLLIEGRPE